MANLLSGASFPVPNVAWTLTGSASVTDSFGGHTGTSSLQLTGRHSHGSGDLWGTSSQAVSVTPGETYNVALWINGDAYSTTPLRVTVDDGVSPTSFDLAAPTASGWHLWEPGSYTPQAASVDVTFQSLIPTGPGSGLGTSGYWLVDDVSFESDAMSKRRDIREALVAAIGTVTTGNGYSLTLGEVTTGTVRVPDGVEGWPHVQVRHGEEVKQLGALQRKASSVTFLVGVFCKADGSTEPDDQCDDACGEIEKAVESFSGGQFLSLGYVQNVFVNAIDPEELPPELHRDTRLWVMTIQVDYTHDRRDP
jgi:hypothetical protein